MKKKRIGLYPGSFDPVTNGHLDIIFRAHKLVDQLVIGVAKNHKKDNLFSMSKRKELILNEIKKSKYNSKCFKVVVFDGLLMNFAQENSYELWVASSMGQEAIQREHSQRIFLKDFQKTIRFCKLNKKLYKQLPSMYPEPPFITLISFILPVDGSVMAVN